MKELKTRFDKENLISENQTGIDEFRCPHCKSLYGYMTQGKEWVCRRCGTRTKLKKEENKI